MNLLKNSSQNKRDIIFITSIIAGFFFLLWKSKYGMGGNDEAFYLTIPHRIVKGDGMFLQEWNLGQFSSFLMLPAMKVYLLAAKGTEGIILHFRYLYIIMQILCTVVLYVKLRKYTFAIPAVLCFFIFCPYDIMAVSYNTMGLVFMTLTGVLLAERNEKNRRRSCFPAGLLFAAAVLCNPFLVLLYVVYSVAVFVKFLRKREKEEDWIWITAGACALAAVFIVTVLQQSGVTGLLENLPHIMKDPEHTSRSLFMIVQVYLSSFWKVYGVMLPIWAVLLAASYLCRKKKERRKICFALLVLSVFFSWIVLLREVQNNYNFIMVPILVCGLGTYMMTEKKEKALFRWLYLFSFAYSFMANYASNQGMHAISMALVPGVIASVLFIGCFLRQESGSALVIAAATLVLFGQLGSEIYAKTVHTFWEKPIWELNTTIEEGPLKGTVTTAESAQEYKEKLVDIKENIKKQGPVLFVTENTWCYLYADTDYGTFSSYMSGGMEHAVLRWEEYFGIHKEKIPYYIWIPIETEKEEVVEEVAQRQGYEIRVTKRAYHLYRNN